MRRKIVTDSSANLLSLEGIDFVSVPLTVYTDEKSFIDDKNINIFDMLNYLEGYDGKSFTSCPSIDAWLNAYNGADEIFVVTITKGLSGSFNSAKTAADIFIQENKNVKIHIFDTLTTGPEMQLLIEKIAEEINKDISFNNICKTGNEYIKYTRLFVALESFKNLANNGRVSKTVAKIAGILGIRIMATASLDGTIEITSKCRGEKGILNKFLECMQNAGYSGGKVCIHHCNNTSLAQKISMLIKESFPNANVRISKTRGLCSYYAENGGIILGCECNQKYI